MLSTFRIEYFVALIYFYFGEQIVIGRASFSGWHYLDLPQKHFEFPFSGTVVNFPPVSFNKLTPRGFGSRRMLTDGTAAAELSERERERINFTCYDRGKASVFHPTLARLLFGSVRDFHGIRGSSRWASFGGYGKLWTILVGGNVFGGNSPLRFIFHCNG